MLQDKKSFDEIFELDNSSSKLSSLLGNLTLTVTQNICCGEAFEAQVSDTLAAGS